MGEAVIGEAKVDPPLRELGHGRLKGVAIYPEGKVEDPWRPDNVVVVHAGWEQGHAAAACGEHPRRVPFLVNPLEPEHLTVEGLGAIQVGDRDRDVIQALGAKTGHSPDGLGAGYHQTVESTFSSSSTGRV